jgi:hypothetical protein
MPKSTAVVTDLTTAAAATYSAASEARAIAAAGPMTDLDGMVKNLLLQAQELKIKCIGLVGAAGTGGLLQSGDAGFTEVDNVRQVLV